MSALSQFLGSGIKSIQRGTVALTGSGGAVTVAAVVMAKSTLTHLGSAGINNSGTTQDGAAGLRMTLTNSTTVTFLAYYNLYAGSVSYELVEYY
jgi:hypothetical protein